MTEPLHEGWPLWANDQLCTHIHIRFDLRDRLKILIAGRVLLNVRVWTEVPPGEVLSEVDINVPSMGCWPWQRPPSMQVVAAPAHDGVMK